MKVLFVGGSAHGREMDVHESNTVVRIPRPLQNRDLFIERVRDCGPACLAQHYYPPSPQAPADEYEVVQLSGGAGRPVSDVHTFKVAVYVRTTPGGVS